MTQDFNAPPAVLMLAFHGTELLEQDQGAIAQPPHAGIPGLPLARQLVNHKAAIPQDLQVDFSRRDLFLFQPAQERFKPQQQRAILSLIIGAILQRNTHRSAPLQSGAANQIGPVAGSGIADASAIKHQRHTPHDGLFSMSYFPKLHVALAHVLISLRRELGTWPADSGYAVHWQALQA
jgi:hypothetical protein